MEVAQIIDEAKNLKLFKGSIKCGDSVIKIGTNELQIQTASGSRNYADISDNGDFILTFNTSLGELGVRLYRDIQNKNIVKIEIDNQEKVNQLMNKKEEIGKKLSFRRF
ncbi:hypothetical protein [Wolbachia endosymbiont of Chironomus riparius]|uniref:hypothetical protein n=1 Tax=Wolbachia endosymbiont of Chironomus riparius TaxID=2883238 RepID=UPI0020A0E8B3|nr:hypothetical protein [Wolbachia endosymbiont of Chironomus riparius]